MEDISKHISMENRYTSTLAQYPNEESMRYSNVMRKSQFGADHSGYGGGAGSLHASQNLATYGYVGYGGYQPSGGYNQGNYGSQSYRAQQ
mmetsp:Transcript_28032/g.24738  ORF Transcript_28032/g.24738 Transcript_28032/m.24738 type:complete len:90 (+) Transcript_28032:361-630(+)